MRSARPITSPHLDRAADRADATGAEDDLSRYNAFLAAAGRTDSDSRRTVRPDQP
ncbi:hypothetical protein PSH03_002711 [Micromonospora sp. PSH03]|uniref:hypothetical protein n=1 Tax=Micromonospora TaxID=1873 RepID=UPI001B368905|nr:MULTISPECIES: hypothetical protein [Micromonospora]MBQ0989576.1 hypothetical protein [Micromonospora sp. H61]MCG5457599.1 hypothetical protein [Micromonospora salmantinae]